MGDFVKTGAACFNDGGGAKLIGAAPGWTYGDWQEGHPYQGMVVLSWTLTPGAALTKLEAFVQLGVGDIAAPTIRGPVPQIDAVSGGETTWKDSIQVLPLDAGPHVMEIPLRANFHWRIGLRRTGGDATTAALMVGDVIR